MSELINIVTAIGKPIIEDMGYYLVDVEYVKEGKNRILRFLIDSENGVDIDDCAIISERISSALDETDPIEAEYILEISSPGAERPLKTQEDIYRSINKYVNVRLKEPINNRTVYEGDLLAFDGETLTLQYRDKTVTKTVNINYDQIAKIRLAIKF
ncbi:MAG: ribosome maturation factor RimP [Bacilli bacterium]|nr:ribosome maturation factor RimP [Bacilli bacterium]